MSSFWPTKDLTGFGAKDGSLSSWSSAQQRSPAQHADSGSADAHWYALYTLPQNEFQIVRKLAARNIDSFLPTYEVMHTWKNRRRMKITKPLFPTYVFVRARKNQHGTILSTTGAIRIVGSQNGPSKIPDDEIDFLRSEFCRHRLEPYQELAIGERVRIRRGPMEGIEGVLVRKANGLRFVLTVHAIQQSVALEVAAEDLEPSAQVDAARGLLRHDGATRTVSRTAFVARTES